jgi:hypothetical protein
VEAMRYTHTCEAQATVSEPRKENSKKHAFAEAERVTTTKAKPEDALPSEDTNHSRQSKSIEQRNTTTSTTPSRARQARGKTANPIEHLH